MNELFSQERRQHPRHEADLQVTFSSEHVPPQTVARTHDIGTRGFGLAVNARIQPGLWLDVDVQRNGSGVKIHARGRVAWVNKITDDHYHAGIELASGDFCLN